CGERAVEDRYLVSKQVLPPGHLPDVVAAKVHEVEELLRSTRSKLLERERAPAALSPKERRVLEGLEVQRAIFAGSDPYAAFSLWAGCGRDGIEDRIVELVNEHHPDHYAIHGRSEITSLADEVFTEMQKVYQLLLANEQTNTPKRPRPGTVERDAPQ